MKPQRIFIGVLDWGLGHATRCMPMIDRFIAQDKEVVLGSNGRALSLFRRTYPKLLTLELPPYQMTYTRGNQQTGHIIKQVPRLLGTIRKEHQVMKSYVEKYDIHTIISDNRYGIWHSAIPSVFITHQLSPVLPSSISFLRPWVHAIHKRFIGKFDECWIPDLAGETNLSGSLGHVKHMAPNFFYIGLLSRFYGVPYPEKYTMHELRGKKPDILVVISGPEPQRSMLEEKVLSQAKKISNWVWIVGGKTESNDIFVDEKHSVIQLAFLGTQDLCKALQEADWIISRSGYSSLMDYEALGLTNVVLVPTPGQTEQEYLGEKLHREGKYITFDQGELALQNIISLPPIKSANSNVLYDPDITARHLEEWLARIANHTSNLRTKT